MRSKKAGVGRQIINTGGPARTRYNALRAAVITAIIIVCVVVIVLFVRGRTAHEHITAPYGHARPAGNARPAGATHP